jgi:hypothetical protein
MYKLLPSTICKKHDDGIMLAKMDDSPEVFMVKAVEKEIVELLIEGTLSEKALLEKAEELNYEPNKFLLFSQKLFTELEKLELVEKVR